MSPDNNTNPEDEKAPILGGWKNIYRLVIANLILMIILFYWLTQHYS